MSAHGSFDAAQKQPDPYYHYYPIYDNQTCSDHYVTASSMRRDSGPTSTGHRRISKSLERSTSRESSTSNSYRYGVSPERIYTINTTTGPVRSQSAENAFARYGMNDMGIYEQSSSSSQHGHYGMMPPQMHPSEAINRALEHPTCVDCMYQKKPS